MGVYVQSGGSISAKPERKVGELSKQLPRARSNQFAASEVREKHEVLAENGISALPTPRPRRWPCARPMVQVSRFNVISSHHVRTLHPKLHVARVSRALPADPVCAKLAPPLQYRADNGDRCREIGGYRPRACPDALGPHSQGFRARAAIASPHVLMRRIAGMLQRHCVEPFQELVDIDKFLVSVSG